MSKNSALHPDSTPSSFKKGAGVKRINKIPIIIVGVILTLFVFFAAWVAILKNEQQKGAQGEIAPVSTNEPTKLPPNDPVPEIMAAAGVTPGTQFGSYTTTIIPAEEKPQEDLPSYSNTAASTGQQDIDLPAGYDLPPEETPEEIFRKETRRRIAEKRAQQIELAISSKSNINFELETNTNGGGFGAMAHSSNPLSQLAAVEQQLKQTASMLTGVNPTSDYQSKLSAIQSQLGNSGMTSASMPAGLMPIQEQPPSYEQFDGDTSRWALSSGMQTPEKYTISAGWVLPGQFITGINSELPGMIKGIISRNIYDSATGKHLLIPQGTEAIGQYGSDIIYGQERVLFAWQRLNFPDGRYLDLGSMQGADRAGYAGVKDKVNNHFWRVFGSAALMSFITAGIEITQDDGNDSSGNSRTAGDALSEALGQQLGQATAQIIMRNLNIAPTLEIREGNKFSILVTKDITFDKPYSDFKY